MNIEKIKNEETNPATGHTPGPWEVLLHRFEAKRPFYKVAAGDEVVTVADVPQHPLDPWNAEANARLIASAPEMLEALDACLSELEDWNFGHESSEGQLLARAAIAKAEGGAS